MSVAETVVQPTRPPRYPCGTNVSLTPPEPLVIFVTRSVWGVQGELNALFYVRQTQSKYCAPRRMPPDA
jgi:hypothetical protein